MLAPHHVSRIEFKAFKGEVLHKHYNRGSVISPVVEDVKIKHYFYKDEQVVRSISLSYEKLAQSDSTKKSIKPNYFRYEIFDVQLGKYAVTGGEGAEYPGLLIDTNKGILDKNDELASLLDGINEIKESLALFGFHDMKHEMLYKFHEIAEQAKVDNEDVKYSGYLAIERLHLNL